MSKKCFRYTFDIIHGLSSLKEEDDSMSIKFTACVKPGFSTKYKVSHLQNHTPKYAHQNKRTNFAFVFLIGFQVTSTGIKPLCLSFGMYI